MTSAVSEMRKETYYVRYPRVHIRASPGWIGDNPDNNQDHYGPAQNLRYQWFTSHCPGKATWLMSYYFPTRSDGDALSSKIFCKSQVPA